MEHNRNCAIISDDSRIIKRLCCRIFSDTPLEKVSQHAFEEHIMYNVDAVLPAHRRSFRNAMTATNIERECSFK